MPKQFFIDTVNERFSNLLEDEAELFYNVINEMILKNDSAATKLQHETEDRTV